MSETAQARLMRTILGVTVALLGFVGSALWNQQQGIIQQLSDRIDHLETGCKATAQLEWPLLRSP